MEDNRREEDDDDGNVRNETHSTVSGRMTKNEINGVQLACDSDSCECHCESSHTREGPRRKSWGGSKYSKGKSKKRPTIPCSSSEACEYDKEHGEDEEEEGEGTQTEYPELSSLLNGLCNSKYGNNSRENSLRYSSLQKNRRDTKNQKPNRKLEETAGNQDNSGPGTSQVQGTSQTCDFMSGLHYAIPFLSDRLRSSLLNRLRCHSEPRDIGTNCVTERAPQTRVLRNEPSDSDSSSERYDLPEIPRPQTQQLPLRCHDNLSNQIPLPCQSANQDRASSSLPIVKNVPCRQKDSECHSQTAAKNLKFLEQDKRMDFCGGCSVQHGDIKNSSQRSCDHHDMGHDESCSCVEDNHDESSDKNCGNNDIWHDYVEDTVCSSRDSSVQDNHDESCHVNRGGNDMWHCVEGVVFSDEDDDIEAAVNRLAEDVGKYNFLEHLNLDHLDEENKDNPGESFGGDNDVWYQYVEGGAGLDHGLAACSDDDRDLEAAVNCLAEQVENIGIIEHVLNKEEDEISSDDSSETVPDLFSSMSSDSCQADDEFECDCGHCVGSGQSHHDNALDLDWQTADRLESSGREDNSSPERIPVGSVTSDLEDDDIEEGVYQISLLPPLDSHQLEAMFETMIAQLQEINLGGGEEQAPPPASASTIESLPSNPVTDQQIDDLAPCSICLSSFVVMDTSSHLPCNHLFHLHCIQAWLAKSATCPVCRRHLESPGNS